MAKRPRNPWRRPGTSFRLGQRGPSPPSLEEQRLTLYLPAHLLDWAEDQATRAGSSTVQVYCARLLGDAIEAEQSRAAVADTEAKRGQLEGFRAITDDPEYLAEWVASAAPRDGRHDVQITGSNPGPEPNSNSDPDSYPRTASDTAAMPPVGPSPAAQVVIRHAAIEDDNPALFLATLRRGEGVPEAVAGELLQALNALEVEYRTARAIDRKVAYALHRLAFEGQILHTDAWPGAIPAETVNTLRVVQEAVDRVLSGEDIRYYPATP